MGTEPLDLDAIEARYNAYATDTLANLDDEPWLSSRVPLLVVELRRLQGENAQMREALRRVRQASVFWDRLDEPPPTYQGECACDNPNHGRCENCLAHEERYRLWQMEQVGRKP